MQTMQTAQQLANSALLNKSVQTTPEDQQDVKNLPVSVFESIKDDALYNRILDFWEDMADTFGHKWTSKHGTHPTNMWTKVLVNIPTKVLETALALMIANGDKWTPDLPQFTTMCKDIAKRKNAQREGKARALMLENVQIESNPEVGEQNLKAIWKNLGRKETIAKPIKQTPAEFQANKKDSQTRLKDLMKKDKSLEM